LFDGEGVRVVDDRYCPVFAALQDFVVTTVGIIDQSILQQPMTKAIQIQDFSL
jgi:hypothetical protein